MTQKRGGNLCAPVPQGQIGATCYINDVDRGMLEMELREYKSNVDCSVFPRNGAGIDPHCADVGLEHPRTADVDMCLSYELNMCLSVELMCFTLGCLETRSLLACFTAMQLEPAWVSALSWQQRKIHHRNL